MEVHGLEGKKPVSLQKAKQRLQPDLTRETEAFRAEDRQVLELEVRPGRPVEKSRLTSRKG